MNAFDKSAELPIHGRTVDLGGSIITSPLTPMTVSIEQSYGQNCLKSNIVPATNGFFDTAIWKMNDNRSFSTVVRLNSGTDYLKIEQHLDYPNYFESTELFLQMQTVNSHDRVLAGTYRFLLVNA